MVVKVFTHIVFVYLKFAMFRFYFPLVFFFFSGTLLLNHIILGATSLKLATETSKQIAWDASGKFSSSKLRPHARAQLMQPKPPLQKLVRSHPQMSWLDAAHSIHGEERKSTPGRDTGVVHTGIEMVYTAAILFGKKVPVLGEEESITDVIGTYFFRLSSLRQEKREGPSLRRGSVDSCHEPDNPSLRKYTNLYK